MCSRNLMIVTAKPNKINRRISALRFLFTPFIDLFIYFVFIPRFPFFYQIFFLQHHKSFLTLPLFWAGYRNGQRKDMTASLLWLLPHIVTATFYPDFFFLFTRAMYWFLSIGDLDFTSLVERPSSLNLSPLLFYIFQSWTVNRYKNGFVILRVKAIKDEQSYIQMMKRWIDRHRKWKQKAIFATGTRR